MQLAVREGSANADRLPGLQALRMMAAMAVFVMHCIFFSPHWIQSAVDFTFAYFPLGVQLFYVISAFALMQSTRLYDSQRTWVTQFYLKRFFRIAPLYYVLIPVTMIASRMLFGSDDTTPLEIVTNVLFINNFWPEYASGIPYAGWSVSVEVLFYLIFPLCFVHVGSIRVALGLAIAAVALGEVARPFLDKAPFWFRPFGDIAFLANFRYFAFGLLAWVCFDRLRRSPWGAREAGFKTVAAYHLGFTLASAALLAVILILDAQLRAAQRFDMVVWGVLFATIVVWVTVREMPLLRWAPFQFLGERSYSLYLMHMLVVMAMRPVTAWVYLACLPALGAWLALATAVFATGCVVVAVSSITYALIERLGMDAGNSIVRRLRRHETAMSQQKAATQ